MGGKLDATNVVTPLVSVITPISYDHTDKLGETLAAIAGEKAGILKKEVPAVVAPQPKEASDVIRRIASERGTPLIEVDSEYEWGMRDFDFSGQRFWARGFQGAYPKLEIPLLGQHQIVNAVTALAVCAELREKGLAISPEGMEKGLAQVDWPGRFQILERDPFLVVDGAQNGASAEALRQTLLQIFPHRPYHLILGLSADKEIEEICSILCPMAKEVIATRSRSVRALLPEELAKVVRRHFENVRITQSLSEALRESRLHATPEAVLVVTGSLYLVGEVLSIFEQQATGSGACGR